MNNTHHQPYTADTGAAQAASPPACQQIKLALDVHAATIVVVRMLDSANPAMLRKRHHPTGRGRSASVTGRPVSLVPILPGD
ncbi:MAG: hypothetical protein FJ395_17900 [Verrucomicrobia bacterium]|nr:hypothetical protein [Verrucomicrobiota bacterium]